MERTDWQIAIDDAVLELLSEMNCVAPPVDAVESLKRLGIEVAVDSMQSSRGRQKTLAGRKAVFLKPEVRNERFQWSAAHELGEVNAWKIFHRLDQVEDEPTPHMREQIANQFASRFLLPEVWFRQDALTLQNHLFELKSRYATASHELIARRLLDFSPHKIVTVIDQQQTTSRVGSAGLCVPAMRPAERACWKESSESGEPRHVEDSSLKIDVWPVHEPGWKREIVITSVLDDLDHEPFL